VIFGDFRNFCRFFYGAMWVLCHEKILRKFRAESLLRNCFSKKNQLPQNCPSQKRKKGTCANGEMWYVLVWRKKTVRIRVKAQKGK
jgi:hypothetical protein